MTGSPRSSMTEPTHEELLRDNQTLRAKLASRDAVLRLQGKLGISVGKLGMLVFVGPRLVLSVRAWLEAFLTSPRALPVEETAQLGAAVIRRMLAIGLVGGVVTSLPIVLLYQQNALISEQSRLIEIQNLVAEATRRSALVFELTDILNEVDEELDATGLETMAAVSAYLTRSGMERIEAESVEDDGERPRRDKRDFGTSRPLFRLSTRLTGRIVALSRALRPYIYLRNDGKPIDAPLSPERAQLLLSLVYSGIDMEDLNHEEPWFHDADLAGANLSSVDLTHAKLQRVNLRGANLSGSILEYARIDGADLCGANLVGVRGLEISSLVINGVRVVKWDKDTRFSKSIEKELRSMRLR